MLLFEQLILSEMAFSHFPSGKLFIFRSSLKCYFSKAVLYQELVIPFSSPHFPTANSYRLLITVWFALCKCLSPSFESEHLLGKDQGVLLVSPPIADDSSITPNT